MGRRSIAEKVCSEVQMHDKMSSKLKLVIYDFAGERIPPRFFDNLKRVFRIMRDGWMLQYSAVAAKCLPTAMAVAKIAKHYGYRSVRVYAVEELA